jgi:tetratricopeptide (TPR) repeat protein
VSLGKLGNVKLQAGDEAGALAAYHAYQESVDIARKLAAQDQGNAQVQRDLQVNLRKIGDLKRWAGDASGSLAAYQESLDIARKLAKDVNNTEAQAGLGAIDQHIAAALEMLGKFEDSLTYDEAALAISERLLQQDDSSETARNNLVRALELVGIDLRERGRLDEALVEYDKALAIVRRLAGAHPDGPDTRNALEKSAGTMGGLAFELLLAKKFEKSLDSSNQAIAAAPGRARPRLALRPPRPCADVPRPGGGSALALSRRSRRKDTRRHDLGGCDPPGVRMIRRRSRAAITAAHRPKVEPVDHLHNEARQMLLRQPLVNRRRQQEPGVRIHFGLRILFQ